MQNAKSPHDPAALAYVPGAGALTPLKTPRSALAASAGLVKRKNVDGFPESALSTMKRYWLGVEDDPDVCSR